MTIQSRSLFPRHAAVPLAACVVVLLPNPARTQFTAVSTGLVNVSSGAVAWGDYDGDGDLDILIGGVGIAGGVPRIYRNDAGVFNDTGAGLVPAANGSLAWGDYDNDGDLDIALSGDGTGGNQARIFRNDAGAFADIGAGLTGVHSSSTAWADYDNDGDLDLLVAGSPGGGGLTKLYRNDAGLFVDSGAGLAGVFNCDAAWGDLDADGDPDLALTGFDGSTAVTRIYRNDGGLFALLGTLAYGGDGGSAAWGDQDGDGDLDLLLTGYNDFVPYTALFRNNGAGALSFVPVFLPGVYSGSGIWGDYDNDGDLDIFLGGLTSTGRFQRVYRNDGSGVFVDIAAGMPDLYNSAAAWGDYDNDGDLDLLLTGRDTTHRTLLYRNDSGIANTPPAAPGGTIAEIVDQEGTRQHVRLSWAPSSDGQTPASGLGYNVRVGTTSGAQDVLAPMALGDGTRLLPALGNAASGPFALVELDAPGATFHWSVQAIDAAFAGSGFAATDSFTLRIPDPVLLTIADIPDDQGGRVRVTWDRSLHDHPAGVETITSYGLWRRVDVAGRALRNVPAGVAIDGGAFPPGTWESVGVSPAVGWDEYGMVAPTLCDSTAEGGACRSVFVVSAHTPAPFTYFVSAADSGCSVDNLAPSVPTGLLLAGALLSWDSSPVPDFRYFSVYGSANAALDGTAVLLGHTIDTSLDVSGAAWSYFHLTATDFAGNESGAATAGAATSVAGGLPGAFGGTSALHAVEPNPTRGRAAIRYDLAGPAAVRLGVYDVSGRLVAALGRGGIEAAGRHVATWNGADAAPGVYFVRLEAGAFTATRRVLVMR